VILDLINEKGVPLDRQRFTWREMSPMPVSKLDNDAFTRVRVILMNGIEAGALRFKHALARTDGPMRAPLARMRRIEQHQQTTVNWLLSADHSPLETTIGYEQTAIEVTAHLAQHEPDPYLAQVYRFGLLEDFDHLYRFAALLDRLEGKDANTLLQSYTDLSPGRPTMVEHRHPDDDLRNHYDARKAAPLTKLNAITIVAGETQTHDYYMNIGPTYADPVARLLYAEIASIEEQHVTQYASMIDPGETPMEKWLLHEATEVWNYWSCVRTEGDARVKKIWERFLDYELGQLHEVMELFRRVENRDPAEVIPKVLPEPISYESQRDFVRATLAREVDLRADGPRFVPSNQEPQRSRDARAQLNSQGVPSEIAAQGWSWRPGGELSEPAVQLADAVTRH
jgi:hypothetical protein